MRLTIKRRPRALLAGLAVVLAGAACTGSAPTDRGFGPLVPCRLDAPGGPTAPPGATLVPPGTIAFGWEELRNVSPNDGSCGAQAVRGAKAAIPASSITAEDTIVWAATLARTGQPTTPDPVEAKMTLFRDGPNGLVLVETWTCGRQDQTRCLGSWGANARAGAYVVLIASGGGLLLAEGRFEIVE